MAEGDFPKTDGDVYYASEVNSVNKQTAQNLKNAVINNKYIVDNITLGGSNVPGGMNGSFGNSIIETFYETDMVNSSTGFESINLGVTNYRWTYCYFIKTGASATLQSKQFPAAPKTVSNGILCPVIETCTNLDAFDDAAVSGNWTTGGDGSVSEPANYLSVSCGGGNSSAYAYWNADDFYQTTKTIYLILQFARNSTSNVPPGGASLKICDNVPNFVTISEASVGGNNTQTSSYHIYKLKFTGTDDTVLVWRDGMFVDNIDLSGLANNQRYISFYTNDNPADTSSGSIFCYLFGEDKTTTASTVSSRIRLDGSNWNSSLDIDEFQTYTNTGINPEVEFTITRDSTEAAIVWGYGYQWEF
jgi:hypothetical protein